jgi:hypothetical protein
MPQHLILSKDIFDAWLENPVTEAFFEEVKDKANQIKEKLCDGSLLLHPPGVELKEYAQAVGELMVLEAVLKARYVEHTNKIEIEDI